MEWHLHTIQLRIFGVKLQQKSPSIVYIAHSNTVTP